MQRSILTTGRKGFTLIELLVVIAIIAILAAILFPVFAKARAKAQQTTCLSNVKQITLGVMMYLSDWDFKFPTTHCDNWAGYGQWVNPIFPYVKNKQIFACPANEDSFAQGAPHANFNPPPWPDGTPCAPFDYGLAGGLGREKLGQYDEPARLIMICESNLPDPYSWGHLYSYPNCGSQTFGAWPHNDGANIGLADGHAKWYHVPAACNTQWDDLILVGPYGDPINP